MPTQDFNDKTWKRSNTNIHGFTVIEAHIIGERERAERKKKHSTYMEGVMILGVEGVILTQKGSTKQCLQTTSAKRDRSGAPAELCEATSSLENS